MKKIFLFLTCVIILSSACTKNETCTCKVGNTVTFTESTSDDQKVETDCENYAKQANSPGSATTTVCQVQ